jgi:Mg-chelatase subunit ChlD
MNLTAALEKWCWNEKDRFVSNSQIFSLSRSLSGKQEVSKDALEQAVRDAISARHGKQQATKKTLKDNLRRFDEQAQQELLNAFKESQPVNDGKKDKGSGCSRHESGAKDSEAATSNKATIVSLRQIAAAIMDELLKQFPDKASLKDIKKKICYINKLKQLADIVEDITNKLNKYRKESVEQQVQALGQGKDGGLSQQSGGNDSLPADGFGRIPFIDEDKESFNGIYNNDAEEELKDEPQTIRLDEFQTVSLLERVINFARKRRVFERQIHQQFSNEIRQADLQSMLAQLVEERIISQTFNDTFLINQERVALQLAKEAFLKLSKMFVHKPLAHSGTHNYGRRGITAMQLDRVERSRCLTTRISPMHTLRQGLSRRALYQASPILDEEDLINYESRTKVGYSIILAMDVSGAMQFGGRIRGVRKACMAFGYYLNKYHPRDRIFYVAYHEKTREISLADVSRLKAINGTGKDIGGCLKQCLTILKRDPERVPAIVLIGDGLPVRGDQAGFYNFKNNNREVIDNAYYSARLLRKNRVLFTFLQFREDRHLWEDYADEAASRIAKEAKGLFYQIDDPITIAPTLIQSFRRIHAL